MNRSSREDAASVRNLFVMAVNLNNAAQYNGCKGVVVNYSNERFRVRLKGTFLKLKACNVVICSEAPSPFTRDEALAVLKTIGKCTDKSRRALREACRGALGARGPEGPRGPFGGPAVDGRCGRRGLRSAKPETRRADGDAREGGVRPARPLRARGSIPW